MGLIDALTKKSPSLARELDSKVFYVRGGMKQRIDEIFYVPPGQQQAVMIPRKLLPYYAISRRRGEITDSLTFTEDQMLYGFGTDLTKSGALNVCHWDFFVANETTTPALLREAFTRSVLAEVLGVE
jgi:hypothetical protein